MRVTISLIVAIVTIAFVPTASGASTACVKPFWGDFHD